MKNIQVEGLFIENLQELFSVDVAKLAKEANVSIEEFMKILRPKMRKIVANVETKIAELYIERNKFNLEKFVRTGHANQKAIVKRNRESFRYFILYINACDILYTKACQSVRRKKLPSTVTMSMGLYGLILRKAQQIVSILMDGYTDAAMIIWRSMYEFCITLMVIALEDNDELADRYYRHGLKNSKRKAESYQRNHKALKFRKLPDSTFNILHSEESKAAEEFGKSFVENDFGWADILKTDGRKATLRDLEEIAGFSRYRPYYIMCSEQAHTNFNAFKHYMVRNKVMLNRLLDQEIELDSMIDPMQFTISILEEVTDYMLYTFSIPREYDINKKFLRQLFENMQQTYKIPKKKTTRVHE